MNRATPPYPDTRLSSAQIEALAPLKRLRNVEEAFASATPDLVQAILEGAARFAQDVLVPLNEDGEQSPPSVAGGRVRMSAAHRHAWKAFADAGWIGLDLPERWGGQGLPLTVAVAAQELFDRACPAFGMLTVPIRSAVLLIDTFADDALKAEWLPRLVAGEWGATICISESGAGSDVSRMTTRARRDTDGEWRIDGEKQWISFGDHDLADRIGHCLLARTPDGGLSLFLVPDTYQGTSNGVILRRLEHKLGLHLSPTCALGFENARGVLLGTAGRGLAQMFVMITNMRLAVGAMGLGIAAGAADTALAYAEQRIQGGGRQGCAIVEHVDVQRQLLDLHAPVEMLRGLLTAVALQIDIIRTDAASEDMETALALSGWLLPIVKTLGAETSFDVASGAIQVLGGAGYTAEWPVEQALRDARILPIFEGTTGIQGLDLVHRRLIRDEAAGLRAFLAIARADLEHCEATACGPVADALDALEDAGSYLRDGLDRRDAEAGATAFLHLAGLAALGWTAARLNRLREDDLASARIRALARYFAATLPAKVRCAAEQVRVGASAFDAVAAVRAAASNG